MLFTITPRAEFYSVLIVKGTHLPWQKLRISKRVAYSATKIKDPRLRWLVTVLMCAHAALFVWASTPRKAGPATHGTCGIVLANQHNVAFMIDTKLTRIGDAHPCGSDPLHGCKVALPRKDILIAVGGLYQDGPSWNSRAEAAALTKDLPEKLSLELIDGYASKLAHRIFEHDEAVEREHGASVLRTHKGPF